jgi:hypothetical protein
VKNIRILLISIPAIIVTSAIIGCVITFGAAPHAALARICIDIGALIALVWIAYTLPKPEVLDTDDIVDGLRDLAKNRFNRRLAAKDHDELFQVRQAFNELAGTLGDSRDPSLTHIRYNPMNRIEVKVSPLVEKHHSLHPELGQVRAAPELSEEEPKPEPAVITYPDPTPNLAALTEELISDHAFEQAPDVEAPAPKDDETLTMMEMPPSPEEVHLPAPQLDLPPAPPARPETYASDIGAADLFFLFERFKSAHDQADSNAIDFDSFLTTVKQAREELMRAHHCKDVKFEVVSEAGAVALRPRLIR